MPTPGFEPDTLDESGCPVWISDLAVDDPNHLVQVVRDLEPEEALELLGAERQAIAPCELPPKRPDAWTSLPRAAIGPVNPTAVLLAGRVGDWTFVYDDLGLTLNLWQPEERPLEAAQVLSGKGKTAATSYVTITGHAGFVYAADGDVMTNQELFGPDELDEDTPAEIRAVLEQAGTFETDFDDYLGMRAICLLAELPRTLQDLRRIPLLVAPLESA